VGKLWLLCVCLSWLILWHSLSSSWCQLWRDQTSIVMFIRSFQTQLTTWWRWWQFCFRHCQICSICKLFLLRAWPKACCCNRGLLNESTMDQSTHGKMSHTTTPLCLNHPTSSFNQNVANINVVKASPFHFLFVIQGKFMRVENLVKNLTL